MGANGTANEYGPVLALINAANTTPGPLLTARMSEVADIEQWLAGNVADASPLIRAPAMNLIAAGPV